RDERHDSESIHARPASGFEPPSTRSIIRSPVRDDDAFVEIDAAYDRLPNERNQPLLLPGEHEHVVAARREQVIDRAEHLALQRADLQRFVIRTVKLSRPARQQLPPLERDLDSDPLALR